MLFTKPAPPSLDDARRFATRVLAFALVSGLGLALDFCLFLALVEAGARAGWANLVSASAAVSFVYFASVRRIFAYEGRFLLALFLLYLGYQALAVALASWAVDALTALLREPALAKGLILPVTFSANYLFMSFLTRARRA
jgi:putative flippase GtrA